MKLSIYSLRGIEFFGEASGVNVKTAMGELTILDHHRPIISILESGPLKILKDGRVAEEKQIRSGFLEMDDKNNLKLLIG